MRRIFMCALLLAGALAAVRPGAASAGAEDARPLGPTADFWRTEKYCGVTVAYMMLRLHGVGLSYDSVKDRLPISGAGSNLEDMRLLLRRYIPARVVKMNRQELFE